MKLKRTCIFLTAIIIFLLMNAIQLKAQGVPTACDSNPDLDCPIDTTVFLLVAAILFLSVKKIYATQNSLKQPVKEV